MVVKRQSTLNGLKRMGFDSTGIKLKQGIMVDIVYVNPYSAEFLKIC